MDFVALAQQFGPLVALIGYFVWRDSRREDYTQQVLAAKDTQLSQQASQLADVMATLATLTARCEDAMRESTIATNRHADVSQALLTYLRDNGGTGAHRALNRT